MDNKSGLKLLLIYNPYAGHGRAKKILQQVQEYFEQKNIDFDIRLTERPKHATEIVRAADFGHYDGVVAAGGDGTVFEVINGYFQNKSEKRIPIGVLPIGTGNAFARLNRRFTAPDFRIWEMQVGGE